MVKIFFFSCRWCSIDTVQAQNIQNLILTLTPHWILGRQLHTYGTKTRGVETGGSGVQEHPRLYSASRAILE